MFRDSIKGMDRIFQNEPPEGSIVIVVGKPGTMKSSLAHAMISSYLWRYKDKKGMYISMEETKESHLRNMRSLNIAIPEKQYFIKDMASFEAEIAPEDLAGEKYDEKHFEFIIKEISRSLGLYSDESEDYPKALALDSLNAFKNLFVLDERKMRVKMQNFFQALRRKEITSLIISEGDPDELIPEYFMVDGIIEVGIDRSSPQLPRRYIMVRKMRGTSHRMEPYMLEITDNGLEVGEPLIGWKK
jgi:KaiC/GvpD/RAD55 family RecA-like ATPase